MVAMGHVHRVHWVMGHGIHWMSVDVAVVGEVVGHIAGMGLDVVAVWVRLHMGGHLHIRVSVFCIGFFPLRSRSCIALQSSSVSGGLTSFFGGGSRVSRS